MIRSKKILFFIFFFTSFFVANRTYAASLFLRSSQNQVVVGNIVKVQVLVDTSGKWINNIESVFQYPKDMLEAISIDKSSIFSLWVQEPIFSNINGQVSFNGGVPNPGYQGNAGSIISVAFKVKKAGVASIFFLDSAVRENDGLGTDILSTKSGVDININNEVAPMARPVSVSMNIKSSTHPESNNWYNSHKINLSWVVPKGTVAVKTLIGSHPDSVPVVYNSGPITTKKIDNMPDGIWYFHANYLNDGFWSSPDHFKIKIDSKPPTELTINEEKNDSGVVVLNMKATDELSGIDHFEIISKLDEDNPIIVKADQDGLTTTEVPFSIGGEHQLEVFAYDKAGNYSSQEIIVSTSIASKLSIDVYPDIVKLNDVIEASGIAPYPNAQIRISLKDENGFVTNYDVKSDSNSKFQFISEPMSNSGKYILWSDIVDINGEPKYSSSKFIISVKSPLILQIGSYTIGLMKILIPAVSLLVVFILVLLFGWFKFFSIYRKIKIDKLETERFVSRSFQVFRKDIRKHILKLKKAQSLRELTREELEFLYNFEEELDAAEDLIDQKIDNNKKK